MERSLLIETQYVTMTPGTQANTTRGPPQLKQLSLAVFARKLRWSLSFKLLTTSEMSPIELYLKAVLFPSQHHLVVNILTIDDECFSYWQDHPSARLARCQWPHNPDRPPDTRLRQFLSDTRKSEDHHSCGYPCVAAHYICNRNLLASSFGETAVHSIYSPTTSTMMPTWDLQQYKKIQFTLPTSYALKQNFDYSDELSVTRFTHNLLNYVFTMTNVVHFEINVCPPKLLFFVSKCCQSLETLILPEILDCESSIVGLCGFRPKKLTKADAASWSKRQSLTVCHRLQHIELGDSDVKLDCVTLLLNVFLELRCLKLHDDCSLADTFQRIYGTDTARYGSIRRKYKVTNVHESYTRSDYQWSLLVQVCPEVSSINMVLGGAGRYDTNILAELQSLEQLTCLKLTGVNMDSLFRFLQSSGHNLKHLALSSSHGSWHSFSRSHLQRLARDCPNLVTLSITVQYVIRDIEYYESPAPRFEKLESLQFNFEGDLMVDLQDILFLLSSPYLKFVQLHKMPQLSHEDCDTVLELPCFSNMHTFYHGGLIATPRNLDKLLEACPHLARTELSLLSEEHCEHMINRAAEREMQTIRYEELLYTCRFCLHKETKHRSYEFS